MAAVAGIHANVQQMATHYGDRLKGTSGKLDAASVAYAATDSTGAAGIAAVDV